MGWMKEWGDAGTRTTERGDGRWARVMREGESEGMDAYAERGSDKCDVRDTCARLRDEKETQNGTCARTDTDIAFGKDEGARKMRHERAMARSSARKRTFAVLVGELERLDEAQGLVDAAPSREVVDGHLAHDAGRVDDEESTARGM